MYERETELTEKGKFRLFVANEKRKRQTSACLLQTEMDKKFVFLGWQAINGN
jgi:hypothetical protein